MKVDSSKFGEGKSKGVRKITSIYQEGLNLLFESYLNCSIPYNFFFFFVEYSK